MTALRPTTARQFQVLEPFQGALVDVPLPPVGESHVLVRSLYSGISRGTEGLVFRGEVPPSQYQVMRAPFQYGDFPGPVAHGYMSVGEVLQGPPALRGAVIFCLHPHQDFYVVPVDAVFPLPAAVPPERAVLAASMETAVNGVWDGSPGPGDRITVLGGGVIGHLVAWLCRAIPGTRVTLVDPLAERQDTAGQLGLAFATAPPGEAADLVFHASGTADGLAAALAHAGTEAMIVELSWYGDRAVTALLGEGFHSRRLHLRSSQVGRLPPARAPRWDHRRRLALALDLLDDPALDCLITGESPFEALPEIMPALSASPDGTLCHRLRYRHTSQGDDDVQPHGS